MVLLAGVGVGVSSSVIPYVTDQLAMARLPRATYATMVALLPAIATVIGIVVLTQIPTWIEVAGVALVIAGVAVHRTPKHRGPAGDRRDVIGRRHDVSGRSSCERLGGWARGSRASGWG